MRTPAALIVTLALLAYVPGCSDSKPDAPAPHPTAVPETLPAPTPTPAPAPAPASVSTPEQSAPASTDGFPSGTSTAEGVAADLARAFITSDADLFRAACMPGSFGKVPEYATFLDMMSADLGAMKRGEKPTTGGPTKIARLFKARHLSASGPSSFGYAAHDFNDVMFVDVETPLDNGEKYTNRTLVFCLRDKSWRAMPRPDLYPTLSTGVNDETASTEEWQP